jgi:hypothetical protein
MSNRRLRLGILIFISAILLLVLVALPWAGGTLGKGDFKGYWSASHVLLDQNDPFDEIRLDSVQQQIAPGGVRVYTWNPPWTLVLLLPVAALPYQTAAQIWLVLNLAILAGVGGWFWYRITGRRDGRSITMAMLVTVLFPPSLAAVAEGQVAPWVLLGVIGFEWFWQRRQFASAGAISLLALIKPQITFVTVAYGVWSSLIHRRWRFFGGMAAMCLLSLLVVTALFPCWMDSYWHSLTTRSLTQWQTPTLGSVLYTMRSENWVRFAGLATILFVPWLTKRWDKLGSATMLVESLLLSAIAAPFSWSYDQIVLLPAILQMLAWRRQIPHSIVLDLGLIVLYILPLAMRLAIVDDSQFVWVPPWTLLLYLFSAHRVRGVITVAESN